MSRTGQAQDNVANARRIAELVQLRAVETRRLTMQDYRNAGARYGIDGAALHAFADVESSGGGFSEGRAVILYEPHIFSRETGGKWDGYSPAGVSCSYAKWVPPGKRPPGCDLHPYSLDQVGRWGLLAFAAELDFDAALRSCSWGAFQVLGKWAEALGYPSVWHYVVALHEGEQAHLDAAVAYLIANDAMDAMRKGDWRRVITIWNGPGQVDRYLAAFNKRLIERRKAYA